MATRAPLSNVSSAVAVDSRRQVVARGRKLWPATSTMGWPIMEMTESISCTVICQSWEFSESGYSPPRGL